MTGDLSAWKKLESCGGRDQESGCDYQGAARMLTCLELCVITIQVLTSFLVVRTAGLGLLNTIMRLKALPGFHIL